MKSLVLALAAAAVAASCPSLASAQGPSYENGPVWDFTQVKTADGHFDDYMHWLDTKWKAQEEALKAAGVIVGYKVMVVNDPRQGEPDVILANEYRNMAVFDHSVAEQYAMQAKIAGSLTQANTEQAARGSIRSIMGDVMMREVSLN